MNETDINGKSMLELRAWSRLLLTLALLGIVWVIFSIGRGLLAKDFDIGFLTSSGVEMLTEDDLSVYQRLIVVSISATSDVVWIFALSQVALLSRHFFKGELFTSGIIGCIERFGWALVAIAIAEASCVPLLSIYLVSIKKINPVEELWQYVVSGAVVNLMAGVLVMIIARILRIGARLREDSVLTI